MDALRKAEQQKQLLAEQKQPAPPAESSAGRELELVPHPHEQQAVPAGPAVAPSAPAPARPAGDHLPELPKRLEELDEQFMAHAAAPQPARRPAPPPAPQAPPHDVAADTARANARLLFEAKQPTPENRRNFLIVVGLLTLLAAGGIGGYVWWELQPKGGLVASGVPTIPRTPALSPATPIAAPTVPPAAPVAAAPAPPQAAVPPAPTSGAPASPARTGSLADQEPDAPVVARKPVTPPAQTQAVIEPESPIRLTRKRQAVDPALEQAWQAFNREEFALAQTAWQRALAVDPRNADALHGLAALALQEGRSGDAAGFYLRALEANPKDALALAGLVSLKTSGDTRQTESRLKNLLAEQPDSPYLNFALGNLYVQDQRWAEAQQAFFRAHAADPANPDYLFNLAVSLDQLHKPGLAGQYYRQALAAAEQRPAGFDAALVTERLKALPSE
ncbi:MAG: tetratricopeptide repeat protein [Rhodocyclaceae bacterium]|jgi:tetratricopeptide (TPR) repeat protein|nr:tetratricopeptide repeat protein [Rhodocyclaceae bacterium]